MLLFPPPPPKLVQDGVPAFGSYAGRMDRFDWGALEGSHARSWWWRRMHHKRWQYVGIGLPELFIGVAVMDLGWISGAFVYVFDRQRREMVVDWQQQGLPLLQGAVSDEPVQGARAWFRSAFAEVSLRHGDPDQPIDSDVLQVRADVRGIRLQAELSLAGSAPFLLGVGPVSGGVAHATQKSPALPVTGSVTIKGRRFELDHAVASLDSSNGLLARHTDWRWACAHSPSLGFNLQQGYFGQRENALWLDGRLIPLGGARFEYDHQEPMKPWHISTEDGLVDLWFTPEGGRQHQRNVGVAATRYVQPVGTFSGTVRASAGDAPRLVRDLLGVTEDHRSKW